MKLEGAKINFLGDSITAGSGTSGPSHYFVHLIQQRYGLAEARNYGIGGTRIAHQQAYNPDNPFDQDFCMRADTGTPPSALLRIKQWTPSTVPAGC